MTSLQTLILAQNSMNGNLPDELGTISTLQSLNLGSNSFSGTIPNTFT